MVVAARSTSITTAVTPGQLLRLDVSRQGIDVQGGFHGRSLAVAAISAMIGLREEPPSIYAQILYKTRFLGEVAGAHSQLIGDDQT